ncbi:MAG: tetratricopeptide repeat protein [Clostridiales bacterium]|jgi:tetratricopeptide (TPR) repeat protein|nr:tetratricopeptide repeat protein [Clostridiales bacterium]
MTELLLCVSQEERRVPFKFKMTGINVYTFEEALYHFYQYWKQSIDEIVSDEFITWVNDALGLTYLAAKIKRLVNVSALTERVTSFLMLTDYFDGQSMSALREQVENWETRLEWERLKDKGDYLMKQGDPGWASLYYKKALAFSKNSGGAGSSRILNNLGIAMMQMSLFDDATEYLEQAAALDPSSIQLALNLAEAAVFARDFDKAARVLKRVESVESGSPDIPYLRGELNLAAGDIRSSIEYFERALKINPDPHYIYRLADVYVKLRQYERALETLKRVTENDKVLLKQAEVYVMSNNVPAAIRCIERALISRGGSVELWVRLAMYHRLDYDIERANSAIVKALSLDPENDMARLENARIKKAMGRTKEYQSTLHQVLLGMKKKYRETTV